VYSLSRTIQLPPTVPLTIEGAGINATELRWKEICDGIAQIYQAGTPNVSNLTLRDLTLANTATATQSARGRDAMWRPNTAYSLGQIVCAPGPSNRLLKCTGGSGNSGAFTPFGLLWSGVPSNPIANPLGLPPEPTIRITGTPAQQYKQVVVSVATAGSAGTCTLNYSTDGYASSTPVSTTSGSTSVALGSTGLVANLESLSAIYTAGKFYCSPPFSTGFSVVLGDTIIDNGLTWTVIDGGAAYVNQGGQHVHIERVCVFGFMTGLVFDGTEVANVRECDLYALNGIWVVEGNERLNGARDTAIGGGLGTAVISVRDCNFNSRGIAYANSGGTNHSLVFCNFESAGGDTDGVISWSFPSWYVWITEVIQASLSELSGEGAQNGIYAGTWGPFTGRYLYYNQNILALREV
jgi:hypothetical protein